MIESRYWKEDLLKSAKELKPLSPPKRWTEKRQVNFEKDIIISFFKIRKLFEMNKVSSKSRKYKAKIYCCPVRTEKVNNLNFWDIYKIYDFTKRSEVKKDIIFISNQLIHGGATFGFRNEDKNWGGIYTCSDFERSKFLYEIPIEEIILILKLVGNDYPTQLTHTYNFDKDDYIVRTN